MLEADPWVRRIAVGFLLWEAAQDDKLLEELRFLLESWQEMTSRRRASGASAPSTS